MNGPRKTFATDRLTKLRDCESKTNFPLIRRYSMVLCGRLSTRRLLRGHEDLQPEGSWEGRVSMKLDGEKIVIGPTQSSTWEDEHDTIWSDGRGLRGCHFEHGGLRVMCSRS